MLFNLRVFLTDYNGEEGSTGITITGVDSFATIDAIMVSYAAILDNMSDAYVAKGEARAKVAPTTPQVVKGLASVYDRLILLCTNNGRYGSITIPAPSPLPYLSQGFGKGYLVDKTAPSLTPNIETLVQLLAGTVLPDGTDFPSGEWKAALMVPYTGV